MSIKWQKQRNELNHNWLKNRYLIALGAWLNILEEEVRDKELEHSFIPQILPQWEAHRAEAIKLALDFEKEMTPSVLFERFPLIQCDHETKSWLRPLIHRLWLQRYQVEELISDVVGKTKAVDNAYAKIQAQLIKCSDIQSVSALQPYKEYFTTYRSCCQNLARAIEKFPSEIKVL